MKYVIIKTITFLILTIGLLGVCSIQASALGTTEQFVYDMANLLTDEQEQELQQYAEEYAKKQISVVFVTTDDTRFRDSEEYANYFYDSLDFYHDGVLFLIDMYNREVYIDTVGRYVGIFTPIRIESTLDKGFEYIYSDHFMVFKSMFEYSNKFIDTTNFIGIINAMFTFNFAIVFISISTAAFGAFILIAIHNKHNTPIKVKFYFKPEDGFVVNDRNDIYLDTKTKVLHGYYRKSSSSSSGRSSHGGGGRSF